MRKLGLIAILLPILLSACANKTLEVWQDATASPQIITKIVVVGAFNDETTRRSYEDTLITRLNGQNYQAKVSYVDLPSPMSDGKLTAENLLKNNTYDAVLYSHLVRVDVRQTGSAYSPGILIGGGSRGIGWGFNVPLGRNSYNEISEIPIIESQFFDKTGRLIWSLTQEGSMTKKGSNWANNVADQFLPIAKTQGWLPKSP